MARTPRYPEEDEKLRASSISRRRGGNCPNSLEVLQQLTAHCVAPALLSLVSVLPARSSSASQEIKSAFEPRVSLDHCIYREQFSDPACSYIIKSQSSGSRTIVNYNELPEMTFKEFTRIADDLGPRSTWFHFEGRIPDVMLACIRYLRENFSAVRVSVEVEKPARPGLQELAAEADVVFYSKSWALGQGYRSAVECLLAQLKLTQKAFLLCCTWGSDGAAALEAQSEVPIHSTAHIRPECTVADTIGAGDTFIAGMLYSLVYRDKDWSLLEKLSFANHIAGLKVVQEGFAGLDEALKFFP